MGGFVDDADIIVVAPQRGLANSRAGDEATSTSPLHPPSFLTTSYNTKKCTPLRPHEHRADNSCTFEHAPHPLFIFLSTPRSHTARHALSGVDDHITRTPHSSPILSSLYTSAMHQKCQTIETPAAKHLPLQILWRGGAAVRGSSPWSSLFLHLDRLPFLHIISKF